MKIELINITENDDGSCFINVELDKTATRYLIEKGLNTVLLEAITEMKQELK